MSNVLIISNNNELLRLTPPDIVAVTADRNYSEIITADGDTRNVVYQLGHIVDMMAKQLGADAQVFIRIGRSCIVNRNYIYFINLQKLLLILKSPNGKQHSFSAGRDALALLKKLVESEINNPSAT